MDYSIDLMCFYYADAIQARIDYVHDVRAAVWADGNALEQYIKKLAEG